MSCGLTAILYFYLKQRLGAIETRLNTLTDLAQTLATELYQKEKQHLENEPLSIVVDNSEDETDEDTDDESSDDSDDESEDESVSEEYEVGVTPLFKEIKLEPLSETKQIPLNEITIDLDVEPIIVYKKEQTKEEAKEETKEEAKEETKEEAKEETKEEAKEKLIEVSDDESTVKQVSVENDYSQFSLKDLKQKVNDLGGPPLKTKQALINFLKKKV
jgi:hypothetical protein